MTSRSSLKEHLHALVTSDHLDHDWYAQDRATHNHTEFGGRPSLLPHSEHLHSLETRVNVLEQAVVESNAAEKHAADLASTKQWIQIVKNLQAAARNEKSVAAAIIKVKSTLQRDQRQASAEIAELDKIAHNAVKQAKSCLQAVRTNKAATEINELLGALERAWTADLTAREAHETYYSGRKSSIDVYLVVGAGSIGWLLCGILLECGLSVDLLEKRSDHQSRTLAKLWWASAEHKALAADLHALAPRFSRLEIPYYDHADDSVTGHATQRRKSLRDLLACRHHREPWYTVISELQKCVQQYLEAENRGSFHFQVSHFSDVKREIQMRGGKVAAVLLAVGQSGQARASDSEHRWTPFSTYSGVHSAYFGLGIEHPSIRLDKEHRLRAFYACGQNSVRQPSLDEPSPYGFSLSYNRASNALQVAVTKAGKQLSTSINLQAACVGQGVVKEVAHPTKMMRGVYHHCGDKSEVLDWRNLELDITPPNPSASSMYAAAPVIHVKTEQTSIPIMLAGQAVIDNLPIHYGIDLAIKSVQVLLHHKTEEQYSEDVKAAAHRLTTEPKLAQLGRKALQDAAHHFAKQDWTVDDSGKDLKLVIRNKGEPLSMETVELLDRNLYTLTGDSDHYLRCF